MRTLRLLIVVVLLSVSACAINNVGQAGTIRRVTTTTSLTATKVPVDPDPEIEQAVYVPASDVKTFEYCDKEAGFCAHFPYTLEPPPTVPLVLVDLNKDSSGETSYSAILKRVTREGQPMLCEVTMVSQCPKTGNPVDEIYSVRALSISMKGRTLDDLDGCYQTDEHNPETMVDVSGVQALRSYCRYPDSEDGYVDYLVLIIDGQPYEVSAISKSGHAALLERFFDDFVLTTTN